MNTIIKQFKELYPEIFPDTVENDRYAPYAVLNHFGKYCAQHLEDEKCKEIMDIVNAVYQRENLFTCNAIENEFLSALANSLGAVELMKQLKHIPENLWAVYIKVLIETQKISNQ